MATVSGSKPPAISTTCGESPGTAADSDSWTADSAAASQLATWAAADSARPTSPNGHGVGHLHDDGATGLLVEGEDVEPRDRLGGHEAEARVPQLRGERFPGAAQQREELTTVGMALRHEPAGLRGHQGLGRLVDTQHSLFLQIASDGLLSARPRPT